MARPGGREPLVGQEAGASVPGLAIGTGRVALPLAGPGITVEGADAPAAMAGQLRAKPGGESIPVTTGDMAEVPASGMSPAGVPGIQHAVRPAQPGPAGGVPVNVADVLEPGGMFVTGSFVRT
jgi:hypothetical protein